MDTKDILQIVTTIISALSLLGFGVVTKYFWEDKRAKKIQNSEEAKKRAKAEKQEETREVIREEIRPLMITIDQIKATTSMTSVGTLTLLRDRMKSSLNSYRKQGWASSSDKANWFELYNTYKNMGGNHFKEYVDQWKHEIENIQSEEEYKKTKAAKAKAASAKRADSRAKKAANDNN